MSPPWRSWAEDRGAPHPQVVVDGPATDRRRHRVPVLGEDPAHQVRRDLVDHVPAGPGPDAGGGAAWSTSGCCQPRSVPVGAAARGRRTTPRGGWPRPRARGRCPPSTARSSIRCAASSGAEHRLQRGRGEPVEGQRGLHVARCCWTARSRVGVRRPVPRRTADTRACVDLAGQPTRRSSRCSSWRAGSAVTPPCTGPGWSTVLRGALRKPNRWLSGCPRGRAAARVAGADARRRRPAPSQPGRGRAAGRARAAGRRRRARRRRGSPPPGSRAPPRR